jgi:hypothetical protein
MNAVDLKLDHDIGLPHVRYLRPSLESSKRSGGIFTNDPEEQDESLVLHKFYSNVW